MSAISATVTPAVPTSQDSHRAIWNLTNADTANPFSQIESSDRTVQFDGTFDGATAGFEGSLDGLTYYTLHDPQGVAISGGVGKLSSIVELVSFIRPFASGGGAAQAIKFQLLAKKAR